MNRYLRLGLAGVCAALYACAAGSGRIGNSGGGATVGNATATDAAAAAAAAPVAVPGANVEVWLTTPDLATGLARQPALPLYTAMPAADIHIDVAATRQAMLGFGASITDSSAWLISRKLNADQRSALLSELFGTGNGQLGLAFTRLTIGASDFSLTHYSLDDQPAGQTDPSLAGFSLEPLRADLLPVLRQSLAINPALLVMASPWSPPAWMKTNGNLIGGELRPEAGPWLADYLLRYVQGMAAEGVPLYAITLQNEPHFQPKDYPGMLMPPAVRADVIGRHLGPALRALKSPTLILDWDHNWDLPASPLAVLADPVARGHVAGVAWHCYGGDVSAQSLVHEAWPDKDAYLTECSGGGWEPKGMHALTLQARDEIVEATRHWARAVNLWNLALDEHAGPHAGGCDKCRGVVTIDSRTGAVTRNAEYYVLGHASRFVRRGAIRLESSEQPGILNDVAFRNTDDGSLVLIVVNSGASVREFSASTACRSFRYALPAGSVATFVWTEDARP